MAVAVVILVLTIKENKLAAEMKLNGHSEETAEEETERPLPADVKKSLLFILQCSYGLCLIMPLPQLSKYPGYRE